MFFFAILIRSLRLFAFAALASAMLCIPALASDITVASPVGGVQLRSPVWIRAHNLGCEGVPPVAFGYSIDNSTTLVRGETAYDIDVVGQVVSPGIHIVHFKSWTARGLCPVVNAQFAVAGPSAASSPLGSPLGSLTGSSAAGTSAFFLVGRGFAQLGPAPTLTLPYGVPASAAVEARACTNRSS